MTGHGAIAAPHRAATEAGADVLRAGGSAVDAAIAAAAVLCVVYPHNVALGSDAVALRRDPAGAITCLNATGWAGSGTTREELRARHGDRLPARGVDTITVPGAIAGWIHLHERSGRLPLADLLAPAIALAEGGVPVSRSLAAAIAESVDVLAADRGAAAVLLDNGQPRTEGSLLVQEALGATLRMLVRDGLAAFYQGALADRWRTGLQELGSALTADDIATYEVEETETLSSTAFGVRLHTSPPNTQGFSLLRSLAAVSHHSLGAVPVDALATAFLQSNAARDAWLADPRHASVDVAALCDPERLADAAPADGRATGDTVGIAVVDADGAAVSLIQSVYSGFGSAVLEPETGILFQNRGTSFSLAAADPGRYQPRARPRHTLMPVLVTDPATGALRFVQSTMGGQGQPQIHAQLLLRLLAGADAATAVAAPRFVVGALGAARPRHVLVESDLGDDAISTLAAMPTLEVETIAPCSEWTGHANVIVRTEGGRLTAASDPRSDGQGLVVT